MISVQNGSLYHQRKKEDLRMKKKLLALALVFALIGSLFTASALAEEPIVFDGGLTSEDAEISPNTTFDKYTLIRYNHMINL